MPESLPSKKISVVDVPEVAEFKSEFVYNFFVPDERLNEFGSVPSKFLSRPSETFDTTFVDSIEFNRAVPRYVEFTWRPVVVNDNAIQGKDISIRENLDKLYYEDDFSFDDFTSIHYQNPETVANLRVLIEKAYENIVPDNKVNSVKSLQERAVRLNSLTSPEVSSNLLGINANSLKPFNLRFFSNVNGKMVEVVNNELEKLKDVRASVQVNNKLIHDLLNNAALNNLTEPLSNAHRLETDKAQQIQSVSAKNRDSNLLDIGEFDSEITKPVLVYNVDTDGYQSVLQTTGYVIEKYEILTDGTTKTLGSLVVENPQISTTVDLQVKYGATYYYMIRTVGYVEIQAHDLQSNTIMAVGFLVASKPKRTPNVVCSEYAPPPPPSDFQVAWDYKVKSPRVSWSFPPNSQRDIKYFQVFKRPDLTQPFQLIKMFDFDDSLEKTPLNESFIDMDLVEKTRSPVCFFLDTEFTKNSSAIYCVCAVDAHGQSSNYSTQFQVAFDRNANALVKKLMSVSGAPKAYPNIYLNVDTFVDSIKDEGHSSVRVVFNPEYLRIKDGIGNDLGLLKTKALDSYKLNLINIDLQVQQSLTINLVDKTTKNLLDRTMKRTVDETLVDSKPAHTRKTMGQQTGAGSSVTVPSRTTFKRK